MSLPEQLHELGALGARADDAHLAAQHVEELRQLVQRGAAQEAPDGVRRSSPSTPPGAVSPPSRKPRAHRPRAAPAAMPAIAHRAELVEVEQRAVAAHAALAEEDRAGRGEAHHERRARQHRREHDQQQHREHAVEGVLERELQALRVDAREGHQRQAAHRVVADAVVDRVEHARHHRHLDAELLAALDQAADARVGDRGEGHDQVAHAGAPDDLVEVLDGAQHRHVAPAHLRDRAGVVVEEAHRAQPVLGVALQPARHLRADQARAHDQHRLAHQPAAARPRAARAPASRGRGPRRPARAATARTQSDWLGICPLTKQADHRHRHRRHRHRAHHRAPRRRAPARAGACGRARAGRAAASPAPASPAAARSSPGTCSVARTPPSASTTATHSSTKSTAGRSTFQPGPRAATAAARGSDPGAWADSRPRRVPRGGVRRVSGRLGESSAG